MNTAATPFIASFALALASLPATTLASGTAAAGAAPASAPTEGQAFTGSNASASKHNPNMTNFQVEEQSPKDAWFARLATGSYLVGNENHYAAVHSAQFFNIKKQSEQKGGVTLAAKKADSSPQAGVLTSVFAHLNEDNNRSDFSLINVCRAGGFDFQQSLGQAECAGYITKAGKENFAKKQFSDWKKTTTRNFDLKSDAFLVDLEGFVKRNFGNDHVEYAFRENQRYVSVFVKKDHSRVLVLAYSDTHGK